MEVQAIKIMNINVAFKRLACCHWILMSIMLFIIIFKYLLNAWFYVERINQIYFKKIKEDNFILHLVCM